MAEAGTLITCLYFDAGAHHEALGFQGRSVARATQRSFEPLGCPVDTAVRRTTVSVLK